MGNPGEKEEEEKCLSCCSCSFYCPSLARLEVTGCHRDRGVRLQPGTLPREANLCHTYGVLSLFVFPLYLTLLCERLSFQDPCLMVDPSRDVRCSTAALLLFVCVAQVLPAQATPEFHNREKIQTIDDNTKVLIY